MKSWRELLGIVLILGLFALPLVSAGDDAAVDATLRVKLPASATLTIDTLPTRQVGSDRLFVTPPLAPGKTFSYELVATWSENGQQKREVRQVTVRAGQPTQVDFNVPAAVVKTEPKKTDPKKEPTKTTEPPLGKKDPPKKDTPKKDPPKEPPPVKKEAPKDPIKKEAPKEPPVKKEAPKDPIKKDVPKEPPSTKKEAPKTSAGKQRSFLFTYAGTIKDLKPGQTANVWLPMATSTPEQEVAIVREDLPGKSTETKDKEYGNGILHFQATANKDGKVPFQVTYKVTRREVKTDGKANVTMKPAESKDLLKRFLAPDKKVPIAGKPLELIQDRPLPSNQFAAARILYEFVNGHMKYSKEGKGWGQGDAVWACDSKFGNCSDFHSLFISMARGNKIPSKFEMGFPLPPKRGNGPIGGYHCWAWFLPDGKGWVPVDISEANRNPEMRSYYFGNLTEDRVLFSRGRDITLQPEQKGPPLNFFIYPYAEVDGQPYAAEKIERSFAYEDLP